MKSPLYSTFLAFSVLLQSGSPTRADSRWQIERDGSFVTVRIPSEEGVVTWSTAAAALADVADFDGEVLDDAVTFGEIDLQSARTRLSLRALNLVLPAGLDFHADRGDDRSWQLRIEIDLDTLDESTRDMRRRARELIVETVDGDDPVVHGLSWHDMPTSTPTRSKVVILIHGYTSSAVALHPLADALTTEGYQCGFLEYANDGPLTDAGEFLSETLKTDETLATLLAEDDARSVTIVTHSMGGLAARWMLEHLELRPDSVTQLIMLAPPSQGSNIAYLPGALDLFEHWLVRGEVDLETFVERSFADGLEEAHNDLRPSSRFFRELNSCPRCEDVDYTIILGDAGVVSEDQLERMKLTWGVLRERSRLAEFASPRIETILDDPQELLAGSGDGLVAVSRGRLEGVEDTVVLPINHGTVSRQFDSPEGRQLLEMIVDRLENGESSPAD